MKQFTRQQYPIIDAGVDWLTLTVKKENEQSDTCLSRWYDIFYMHRKRHGLATNAAKLGYSGLACEGMFVGTRHDGAMLTLSGQTAKELWREVIQYPATCTRIDIQVTVRAEGFTIEPSKYVASDAAAANEELPESRQRLIKTVQDNRGGMTCYIGSRQSDSFLRCYHKSAQDPDIYGDHAWRYEVQYNRDVAPGIVERLIESTAKPADLASSFVYGWMYTRGLMPSWRLAGEMQIVKRETIPLTELDKKLAWLYKQVRPTVEALLAQDLTEETLVALLGRDLGHALSLRVDAVYEQVFDQADAERKATTWQEGSANSLGLDDIIT